MATIQERKLHYSHNYTMEELANKLVETEDALEAKAQEVDELHELYDVKVPIIETAEDLRKLQEKEEAKEEIAEQGSVVEVK